MSEREKLIPEHGGYRKLKSFQIAQLVYDVTVRFCDRYIKSFRMREQMVQAARSGVQNIAEGSQASGTSRKTELKLTSVGRASLEELRLDYEDFLRQRGLSQWKRNDSRRDDLISQRAAKVDDVAAWIKNIHENGRKKQDKRSTRSTVSTYPEISANAALILIAVACGLLRRQPAAQEKMFEEQGGFTERLYRVRQQTKKMQPTKK